MNSSTMKNTYIEFDLQFDDFKRVSVLVINLLDEDHFPSSVKKYYCDIFNENECHHKENHSNLNELCDFCQFVFLIRQKYSDVKVNNDKECISFKYRTRYSSKILEWTEFQVRRAPLLLIGYALCQNQSDLLYSIKKFENLKSIYKKSLLMSKLFINSKMKQEDNNELITENASLPPTLNVHPLETGSDPKFNQTILDKVSLHRSVSYDTESLHSFDQGRPFSLIVEEKLTNNSDINLECSIPLNGLIAQENKMNTCILKTNKEKRMDIEDKPEFMSKLKTLEKEQNLVYLNYESNFLERAELTKIETTIVELAKFISKKLFDLVKTINPSEDRQLNQYSDFLKTPMESNGKSSGSTLSESSNLSIKLINKKTVAARMHKYKADLHMFLKMYEIAIYHYYQGYQLSKKEEDFLWTNSSIEGLCIASYFYSQENSKETKLGNLKNKVFFKDRVLLKHT
jgi:hypothetical protein